MNLTQLAICKSKSATNYNRIGVVMGVFTDKEDGKEYVTLKFGDNMTFRSYLISNVESVNLSRMLSYVDSLKRDEVKLKNDIHKLAGDVGHLVAENLVLKSKPCKKKKK